MNHHDVELLFSTQAGPDVFGAMMSQQRMKFLLANATFDDPDEPAQCWPIDNANKPHRYGLLVKSLNDA